jgi:threonine/homoserine/homoserine lactone efflux protein
VSGLSALVLASEVAYGTMKVIGAGVLIAMGAQSIWQARRGRPAPDPVVRETRGWRHSYGLGLATCGMNPKAAVFAMSFLPQFVPDGANVPVTLTLLAVLWVMIDTAWYLVLIWFAGRARGVLDRPSVRRRLERISGAVLVAVGVRMALEAR